MSPESLDNLRVGDRLADGAQVIDTRHVKQGAIGIVYDLPEYEEACRKALETFAYEVRRRQFGPWTEEELQEMEEKEERERRFMYLPLDSSI